MSAEEQAATRSAVPVSATAADSWSGFSDVWNEGYREIYAIRAIRGKLPVNDSVTKHYQAMFQWFGLSYGPPIVTLAILAASSSWPSPDRIALLCIIGTVNAGAFAAASMAWGNALRRSSTIDDVLRPCPERDRVVSVISRAIRNDRQSILPLIAASLPWIVAGVHGDFTLQTWVPCTLLLINLSWSLAIIGNVSYWLLVPPVIVLRMRSCSEISLRWNDPARTAGIRTLSEGYLFPGFFLALAALAVTVPGLIDHEIFGAYVIYLYAWLMLLSLWVGVLTQACIYMIIRRFKLRVMDEVASSETVVFSYSRARDDVKVILERARLADQLSVYGIVSSAPGLPFGTATAVQYLAAVVGSVISFLLQFPHL